MNISSQISRDVQLNRLKSENQDASCVTAKPVPSDTAKPLLSDTAKPVPSDTAKLATSVTAKPVPSDTAKPVPYDKAEPATKLNRLKSENQDATSGTVNPVPSDTAEPVTELNRLKSENQDATSVTAKPVPYDKAELATKLNQLTPKGSPVPPKSPHAESPAVGVTHPVMYVLPKASLLPHGPPKPRELMVMYKLKGDNLEKWTAKHWFRKARWKPKVASKHLSPWAPTAMLPPSQLPKVMVREAFQDKHLMFQAGESQSTYHTILPWSPCKVSLVRGSRSCALKRLTSELLRGDLRHLLRW